MNNFLFPGIITDSSRYYYYGPTGSSIYCEVSYCNSHGNGLFSDGRNADAEGDGYGVGYYWITRPLLCRSLCLFYKNLHTADIAQQVVSGLKH